METTYTLSPWSLSDLFPAIDSAEMLSAFAALEAQAAAIEQKRPLLSPAIPEAVFQEFIQDLERLTRLAGRVGGFASLSFSGNTQDQAVQAFIARVDQFLAGIQNHTLFFEIWWKELDEADVTRLLAGSGDFRYWLETMRQFKPHTLSEVEEKIVNIKNVTGSSALAVLYDTITNRYVFKLTVDGEQLELTRGELMIYARSHDPALRQAAYQELYRVYAQDAPILGQIYQTLARDWANEQLDLRHFASPISARNLANDIPDAVIDTLLTVAERNADVFQRYFRLKARWLGLERLRRYDIYAPVAQSDKTYEFNAAVELVLELVYPFRSSGC